MCKSRDFLRFSGDLSAANRAVRYEVVRAGSLAVNGLNSVLFNRFACRMACSLGSNRFSGELFAAYCAVRNDFFVSAYRAGAGSYVFINGFAGCVDARCGDNFTSCEFIAFAVSVRACVFDVTVCNTCSINSGCFLIVVYVLCRSGFIE